MDNYQEIKVKIKKLREEMDGLKEQGADKAVVYAASLKLDEYISKYMRLEQMRDKQSI